VIALLPNVTSVYSPSSTTASSTSVATTGTQKSSPVSTSASAASETQTSQSDYEAIPGTGSFRTHPTSSSLFITLVTVFGVLIVGVVSGITTFMYYRKKNKQRKDYTMETNIGSPRPKPAYYGDKGSPQNPPPVNGNKGGFAPPRMVPLSPRTTDVGGLRGPIGFEEAFAPRLVPKSARTTDVGSSIERKEVPPPRIVPPSARTTDIGSPVVFEEVLTSRDKDIGSPGKVF
jgi:hypothetical protein